MTTRLIPNLEAELEWSLEESGEASPPRGMSRPDPQRLAYWGAAFAALGRPGDELDLGAAGRQMQPGSLLKASGVRILSDPAELARKAESYRPWADTVAAALRAGYPPSLAARSRMDQVRALAERAAFSGIWEDFEVHPEIDSSVSLHRALDRLCADDSGRPWVLKGRWSGAGRLRLRGAGLAIEQSKPDHQRFLRLLRLAQPLWLEPWVEVVAEFGVSGFVRDAGGSPFLPHRSLSRGGSSPLVIEPLGEFADELSGEELAALRDAFEFSGRCLHRAGYRGPFGIDAWRWRDREGELRFRPLAECNLRFTFGHLAAVWLAHAGWSREEGVFVLSEDVARLDQLVVLDPADESRGMGVRRRDAPG